MNPILFENHNFSIRQLNEYIEGESSYDVLKNFSKYTENKYKNSDLLDSIISKKYEGNFTSKNYIYNFNSNFGRIELTFEKNENNHVLNKTQSNLVIEIKLFNGQSNDKWWKIKLGKKINTNYVQLEDNRNKFKYINLLVDIDKKTLEGENFNSFYSYGEFLVMYEDYQFSKFLLKTVFLT